MLGADVDGGIGCGTRIAKFYPDGEKKKEEYRFIFQIYSVPIWVANLHGCNSLADGQTYVHFSHGDCLWVLKGILQPSSSKQYTKATTKTLIDGAWCCS